MENKLTHLDESGAARMVDVGDKAETTRLAEARAIVSMQPETLTLVTEGGHKKGDVLAVARLAGIMGASFTTANAYIADVSNDENRARNFGFVGMMFGLGFTIGPALGGFLGAYNLRLPFFVAAGLALVLWLLPETKGKTLEELEQELSTKGASA